MVTADDDDIDAPGLNRQKSIFIDGRFVPAAQARTILEKKGLCKLCGEVKTHERKRTGLQYKMKPLTTTDKNGNYLVYKGYCISSLCYSLDAAKRALGESVPSRSNMNGKKKKPRAKSTTTGPPSPSNSATSGNSSYSPINQQGRQRLAPLMEDAAVRRLSGSAAEIASFSGGLSTSEHGGSRPSVARMSATLTESGDFSSSEHGRSRFALSSTSRRLSDSGNLGSSGGLNESVYLSSSGRFNDSSGSSSRFNDSSGSSGRVNDSGNFGAIGRGLSGVVDPSSGSLRQSSHSPGSQVHIDSANSYRSGSSGSQRNVVRNKSSNLPLVPNLQGKEEERIAIRELEQLIHEQRFSDFMETLYSNNSLANVVSEAFQLLRNGVPQAHETMGYVFSSPSWLKYFVDAMDFNSKDQSVQVQGVLTLWTLSAVSPRYMKEICKGSGVDAILSIMSKCKTDEQVVEMCCGALECLTSNSRDGISSTHHAAKRTVTRLVETISLEREVVRHEDNFDVVREGSGGSKVLALRALYNLALEGQDVSLAETVLSAAPLLSIIISGEDLDTVEWTIQLLWRLLSPPFSSKPMPFAPFDVIEAVLDTMSKFNSPSFQEAACGLISCAANSSSKKQQVVSSRQAQKVAESIVIAASSQPGVESVQMMSIEILYKLSSSPENQAVIADMDVVSMVIAAMNSNRDNVALQGAACLLLANICGQRKTAMVIAAVDGAAAIVTAFRMHVMNPTSSSEGSEMIKQGSAVVLAGIATNPETAGMLVRSGIIVDLDSALRKGQGSSMPPIVRALVVNALTALEAADSDPRITYLSMEALKGTETAEEAEGILSKIHTITSFSPRSFDYVLVANNGAGIDILLETMKTFLESETVQAHGCAILANVYVQIPYVGKLNKLTQLTLESQTVEIETHSEREVKVLVSAMKKHKNNVKVQDYACAALCNFIAGSGTGADASQISTPDDVVAAFSGISKNVIDAFSIHLGSVDVLRSACRLYWVIAFMNDETEMKLRASHGVSKVCEAMSAFPDDQDLNMAACAVLLIMLENDNNTEFIGSGDTILSMIRCLQSKNEKLVELACELLASTIQTVFTASNEFMDIDGAIEEVILCMDEHSGSASVQKSLCSLIASLVALQDSYVKGLIGNNGGLNSIEQAIRNHSQDEMVVECGCKALSSIVGGCSPALIRDHTAALGSILLANALPDHPTNEVVQEAVLGALWGLCAREPTFNDYIVKSNGLPLIIDTINQHVLVEPVVMSGCSLLWIMASYGENKRLIGRSGIRAIVNGMQAHITSSAVQKEALTGLKNLATHRENKDAIAEVGGVAAIVQSMWVHMNSSQIFCAACSALNNIAVDAKTKRVSRIENGELAPIVFGMKRHETNKEVQMCACFLLKSYTFEPSNVPLMRDEPNLDVTLMKAMERFPADCEDRACYILQRI